MKDLIGQSVGRYHITELLGEGGMASVYKAFDTRLERYVAIKFIRPDAVSQEIFLKRFEREAKALASLSHPNIVKIHDFGNHEGMPYLVMEYVTGGTLKQQLGQPMSPQNAARLIIPIAQALDYTHRHNIIHRDVKPANFLMSETGQPMLSDFGIARMLEQGETKALTHTGAGIGTPEYMAPEQGIGEKVDQRADIYSLGIVFYELVTGKKPFRADTPMAILMKHISEPLPSPRNFVPSLPEEVVRTINRALAKKPDERYQSMSQFAAALENIALSGWTAPAYQTVKAPPQAYSAPVVQPAAYPQQTPPVSTPKPEKRSKSSPGLWIGGLLLGAFACIVLGVVAYFVIQSMQKNQVAAVTATAQSLASTIQSNQQSRTAEAFDLTSTAQAVIAQQTASAVSASQTAQAYNLTQTAVADQFYREQTATVEAQHAASTQTAKESIAADFSLAQQNWRTVYSEYFDQTGDWNTGTFDSDYWNGDKFVINGKFRWSMNAYKGFYHYASGKSDVYSNFLVSVDCGQTSGSENGLTGLVVMQTGEDKYYFFINNNSQQYKISLLNQGEWTKLADDFSTAILVNQINKMMIKSENGFFTLMVNDQFVTQIENTAIREGKICLSAGLSNPDEQATFEFDNLMVQTP